MIATTRPTLSYSCDTKGLLQAASSYFESIGSGTPSYLYSVACIGQYAAANFGAAQSPNSDGNTGQLVFANQGGTWKAAGASDPSSDGASAIGVPVSTEQQLLASLVTAPELSPTVPIPVDASLAFSTAKTNWVQNVCNSAASQGFIWQDAAVDLQFAADNSNGDTAGFAEASTELNDLASIPETSDTPAQMNQFQSDIQSLNSFFGTPGYYTSSAVPTCPGL